MLTQPAGQPAAELGRQIRILPGVRLKRLLPLALEPRSALHRAAPFTERFGRDGERLLVRPPEIPLGQPYFLFTQRRAVGRRSVLLVGAPIGDVRPYDDERGPIRPRLGFLDRAINCNQVVPVFHLLNMPPIGLEPAGHIVAVGEFGRAVNRDPVVVVEPDEPPEPQMTRQRRHLVGDTFHEIAITRDEVDRGVHNIVARTIELGGQVRRAEGHSHCIAEALAQWPRRGLDARCQAVLRMPRRLAAPLAEILKFLQRQVVARQVEQAVEQHRRVTAGEHEAIAPGPLGIGRIVPQMSGPQQIGEGRQGHGSARVPAVRGLHCVHG